MHFDNTKILCEYVPQKHHRLLRLSVSTIKYEQSLRCRYNSNSFDRIYKQDFEKQFRSDDVIQNIS